MRLAERLQGWGRGWRFFAELAKRGATLLVAATRDALRPRARLIAENAALRAQLAALKRQVTRAAPDHVDRVVLATLSRIAPTSTQSVLHFVRPETLLRWHKDLARWLWAWRSRSKGRRRASPRRTRAEIRALVVQMATENDWGAPRITGELLQLGIAISERTVQRILEQEFPDGRPEPTQAWATFLRNHLPGTWACDFFTVTTLRFKTLYVFFLIRLDTREVVLANVTEHPTGAWTAQQLRNACLDQDPPQRLIRDRDTKFTAVFDQIVTGSGGKVLLTPPRTPVANAFAERMVGTFRRELFDRVIPRNEDHVRQLLRDYLAHYHRGRPHQGVEQLTPVQVRCGEQLTIRDPVALDLSALVVTPVLNGLVHEYTLAA